MKNLNEQLSNALINEAKENTYSVQFVGCKGQENEPFNVTISVKQKDVSAFENFMEQEMDNVFAHACGLNNDWEPEN